MAASHKKEMEKLKEYVEQKFEHIREALAVRERLLLRQIDAIATSTQQMTRSSPTTKSVGGDLTDTEASQELRFLVDDEDELLSAIRSFGKFNLDSINLALQDMYMRNEDYITPSNDHEIMYKCLQANQLVTKGAAVDSKAREEDRLDEAITIDFSKNKTLIEHNVSNLNESIVNMTVAEAQELIHKAKNKRSVNSIPSLKLEEINDHDDDDAFASKDFSNVEKQKVLNTKLIPAAGSAEGAKKSKKQRFKPNITINSCNGTINLRNVENLVINCSNAEETSSVMETDSCTSSTGTNPATPATDTSTDDTNSSNSSSASSRSQSQKLKHCNNATKADDGNRQQSTGTRNLDAEQSHDDNAVQCEFYNRLLNEIKNQLKQQKLVKVVDDNIPKVITVDGNSNTNAHKCVHQHNPSIEKRLVLKNFENLKVVLESHGIDPNGSAVDKLHPVQIEQWLAEIISETDLEPMQNTDILEHSRLHKKDVVPASIGQN